MIELKNVYKNYKTKSSEVKVLNNINIKLPSKGLIFILGKSGSGKTTLLNLIGGLDRVTSGSVLINNNDITKFDDNMLDNYRNSLVGFVFQDFNLLDNLSVYKNIELPLNLQKKKDNNDLIKKVLIGVGLPNMEDRNINELSGGEKQRVSIARAMIKNPDIVLADEPTGNLDSTNSENIFNILKQISYAKLVVVVTHDRDAAYKYGNEIIEISDGTVTNVVQNGELTTETKSLVIKKSKLSLSKSISFAFTNLKKKKIRLFISILLVTVSLFLFGYTSFLTNFDINKMHADAINRGNDNLIIINKNNNATDINPLKNLTEDDINNISKLINTDFTNVSRLNVNNEYLTVSFVNSSDLYYYQKGSINSNILSFIEYSSEKINNLKLIGNVPSNNDEIIVNKFFADYMIENGITIYDYDKDKKLTNIDYFPKDYNEIINDKKKIVLYTNGNGNYTFTISGILDEDISKFDKLKTINENEAKTDYKKIYDEFNSKINSLFDVIVNKDLIKDYNISKNTVVDLMLYTTVYNYDNKKYYPMMGYMSGISKEIAICDGKEFKKVNELKNNEIILNIDSIGVLNSNDGLWASEYQKYYDKLKNERDAKVKAEEDKALDDPEYIIKEISELDIEKIQKEFHKYYIDTYGIVGKDITVDIVNNSSSDSSSNTYTVIGYVYGNQDLNDIYNFVNSENVSKYLRGNHEVNKIYFNLNDKEKLENIFDNFDYKKYSINTIYTSTIDTISKTITKTEKLFKYLSIGFLTLGIIILTNYIIVTINSNKKQIGILRSLGTKQSDLFKIYYLESIIIVVISYIISTVLLYFGVIVSNNIISKDLFFNVKPILFNINSLLYMFILIILISFVSSVLPIISLSKKKPIDVIYDK